MFYFLKHLIKLAAIYVKINLFIWAWDWVQLCWDNTYFIYFSKCLCILFEKKKLFIFRTKKRERENEVEKKTR